MIKFTNLTPPRGESHPENHIRDLNHIRDMTTYDVRDLGDGPWRKQLGGVNLKEKYFFFGGNTRRHEERRKKRRDVMQKETGRLTVGNSRYESRSYDIRLLVVLKKQFVFRPPGTLIF